MSPLSARDQRVHGCRQAQQRDLAACPPAFHNLLSRGLPQGYDLTPGTILMQLHVDVV